MPIWGRVVGGAGGQRRTLEVEVVAGDVQVGGEGERRAAVQAERGGGVEGAVGQRGELRISAALLGLARLAEGAEGPACRLGRRGDGSGWDGGAGPG